MITIVVPASYKDHGTELPKKLEKLAKRLKVKSDGGGYSIGSKNYDHWFYVRDREVANKFKSRAKKLGFLPMMIPHFEEEYPDDCECDNTDRRTCQQNCKPIRKPSR